MLRLFRPIVSTSYRPFTTLGATTLQTNLPPRPKPPPDSEIEESYLKGSGPGGQKINKTNSAVQLKHIPTGIVVKSQATRSRSQNRKHAREILAQKVDDFLNKDQSRSAIVGDIKKKKADSAAKKSKRKYKKLEEEKKAATATGDPSNNSSSTEISSDNNGGGTGNTSNPGNQHP
ncbi:putative peptide chain release factor-like protein [Cladobotryum mycophilum]|uniref:Peptide chain release factor-like protein n=1 Tax=Cladobotryum mycophilum TaxID=491253 RepID=A0ABR0SMN6_9HYPO